MSFHDSRQRLLVYETNTQSKDLRKEPVATPSILSEQLSLHIPSVKGSGLRVRLDTQCCARGRSQQQSSWGQGCHFRTSDPLWTHLSTKKIQAVGFVFRGVPVVHACGCPLCLGHTPSCDMDIQPVAGVNPTIQSVGL